jgi:S1-C subfamily serine protease
MNECTNYIRQQTGALQSANWNQLISAARAYLTFCTDTMNRNMEASTLNNLAIGLGQTGQYEDALPINQRCITIKPDETGCYVEIGVDFEGLGKTEEAIVAYRKALSVGGYDSVSGQAVQFARTKLKLLEDQIAEEKAAKKLDQPPVESGPTVMSGTGFFVSGLGHIVTNRHVVDGCRTIRTRDGQRLKLVLLSGTADLALLKQDTHPSASATFRSGLGIRVGDEVIAFGFPLPGILSSEGNISTGTVAANSGVGDDPHFIQVSAPVQPGNSGGPLLDASGNVVGVVVAKLDAIRVADITGDIPENVNFSISRDVVVDFLKSSSVPFQQKPSLRKLKTSDVAVLAKLISIAITCIK